MTVYVDELRQFYTGRRWCHMWSPDLDELHQMADKIGLKRSWFQSDIDHPHYDLSSTKRALALQSGAVACTSVELVKMIREKRKSKPILVLDFDGVLHSYTSGWQGASIISDPPVEGAQAFCEKARWKFDVWVVSSRCSLPGGRDAIVNWLQDWGFPAGIIVSLDGTKPAAFVTLDDRALTFTGEWPSIDNLLSFIPWNKEK